ncbi:MAG TPA: hypothetical protein VL096_12030 [Pirellulaceae bacterium]|nr:hypothetical protein [Pirellulaceae bacterium]
MVDAVVNPDRKMPSPTGHVIGFVDSSAKFQQVLIAILGMGVAEPDIQVYHGQGSIALLQKNRGTFFLGDAEQSVMDLAERILSEEDGYALAIPAGDREEAMRIAKNAQHAGGHSFSYFGTWVAERLTK